MKTILITGCSSGIGKDTTLFLRKQGYRVIPTARKKTDVEKLRKQGFDAYQLDTESSKSIQSTVNKVLKKYKRIDVLFNNAGFAIPGAIEDFSRDAIRTQFETNLFGHIELTNLIIPIMRKQRYGKIIWNSSVLGLVSMPYRGLYNASKFAMEAVADSLRLELKNTNIHVSIIEPGPIIAKFNENALKAFRTWIKPKKTQHKRIYDHIETRLQSKQNTIGTLPARAVSKKVLRIIQAKRPKRRYYVTWPTYMLAFLKRILPSSVLDIILLQEIKMVKK